jgi:hypothetical protein
VVASQEGAGGESPVKSRGCVIENGCVFSSKFQRNNRKNASAIDFDKGKAGEKVCIFTVLWR